MWAFTAVTELKNRRQGSTDSFKVARSGVEDDGEQYDSETMGVAQSSTDNSSAGWIVPEARPWYEWCRNADGGMLDLCKQYGKEVCDYMNYSPRIPDWLARLTWSTCFSMEGSGIAILYKRRMR